MGMATSEGRLTNALLGALALGAASWLSYGHTEPRTWVWIVGGAGLGAIAIGTLLRFGASDRRDDGAAVVLGTIASGTVAWLWWGTPYHALAVAALAVGGFGLTAHIAAASSKPRAERPVDYLVTDRLLAERFAGLAEGAHGAAFGAFLAQREPGDELWCIHEVPADPRALAGGQFLVILRPAAADGPIPPRVEREVARFQTYIH